MIIIIIMEKLKLILTIKKSNLLYLTNYTFYFYIIKILNIIIILKLKIFLYFNKIITVILIKN